MLPVMTFLVFGHKILRAMHVSHSSIVVVKHCLVAWHAPLAFLANTIPMLVRSILLRLARVSPMPLHDKKNFISHQVLLQR